MLEEICIAHAHIKGRGDVKAGYEYCDQKDARGGLHDEWSIALILKQSVQVFAMPTADFAAKVESDLEAMRESDEIHVRNAELAEQFIQDIQLEGLSAGTRQKYSSRLKIMAQYVDEPFDEMDKRAMKGLVIWLQNERDLADSTVRTYKKCIKRFWGWMHDLERGEHPEVVDWIKCKPEKGNGTLPQDLLKPDDIEALADGCRNARDAAFIKLLYESGMRAGEIIDLTVGDVESADSGYHVTLGTKNGGAKTGPRRLPIIEAAPAVSRWLSDHPTGDKTDPLWCKLRSADQLSYDYIRQKVIDRAGKRAAKANPNEYAEEPDTDDTEDLEFHKPLNPHHFRHSRATELANEMTDAQLCQWFGWEVGSTVVAKYVHLSGRDIDDQYQKMYGILPDDQDDEPRIEKCPRCGTAVEPDARFCYCCGHVLDGAAADELETAEESVATGVDAQTIELAVALVDQVGPEKAVELALSD